MDIGLFIVLMIVVYVVPELLKRFKKKKPYQYPNFPSPLPPTGQQPSSPGIPGELSRGMKPPPMPVFALQEQEGTAGDEGDPQWEMRMTSPVIGIVESDLNLAHVFCFDARQAAQGVIWAEIIAPPLALRQMRQRMRR
jgi:hypothetical protein